MRQCIILLAAALSACGANTPPPATQVQIVRETVEVTKPCPATKPQRPAKLAEPKPTNLVALAAVLAAKLLEYDGPGKYADRAEAALNTCIEAGR